MTKTLSDILLLEPGGEIRIGDGSPGVNFTGIRIYKTMSGFGFETYENNVLRQWIDEHGVLQKNDIISNDGIAAGVQKMLGTLILGPNDQIRSDFFLDGMLGKGFQVAADTDGSWNMVIDKLRVRGSMSVMELLFQQVRATNGSLWITSTAKVKKFRGV